MERGHRGNPRLKRVGEVIEFDQDMMKEYIRCGQDPIYFIRTYFQIINVDDGLVPFNMYDYQEEMVHSMLDNRRTIITTARQTGKSTTTCAFILWYILFGSHRTVGLLANKGNTAREILSKIKFAYEHLPKWLQQGVVEWNKGSIELENDSRVVAEATSSDAIRGYACNLLFIDEAAFIENWDEFFTSVMPTVTSGKTTKIILVSTPNGMNHFYQFWKSAIEGINGYNPIMVKWQEVPGRDEAWKNETLAALNFDEQKFAQENNCEFFGSSGTLIAGWKLKLLKPQTSLTNEDESLYQYNVAEKNHTYAVVVDVSRGKGLDYSAFQIIDVTEIPYKQVCVYRSNIINVVDYADVVFRLAKYYNESYILVEINDIGGQVADILFNDYEYENILYTMTKGRKGKVITTEAGNQVDRGIRTTETVKTIGCSLLKMIIEQDKLIINDLNTITELTTFAQKKKTFKAEAGKHDDLVMGLVLFAWLTGQDFFKDLTNSDLINALREKTEQQLMDELLPFGIMDDGNENIDNSDNIEFQDRRDWFDRTLYDLEY